MPQGCAQLKRRRPLQHAQIPGRGRQHVTHTKFVPLEPQSGLEAEKECALVIALTQLRANLLPRKRGSGILVMGLKPGLDLLDLGRRQSGCLGVLSWNAVPNILRKLDSLGDGKTQEIGSRLAHGGSINPCFSGGSRLVDP